jgi:hypothetical protein
LTPDILIVSGKKDKKKNKGQKDKNFSFHHFIRVLNTTKPSKGCKEFICVNLKLRLLFKRTCSFPNLKRILLFCEGLQVKKPFE